ncbi:hypothetical protein PHMEG_00025866, partial [Phytophthora megakarya]
SRTPWRTHSGSIYEVDPLKTVRDIVIARTQRLIMLQLVAQFLGYAQMTAMVLLLFGELCILPTIGVDVTVLHWSRDNHIAAFFIVVFMGIAVNFILVRIRN